MLPVTNNQLADKGFVVTLRVAYEFFLNPFMGVGAQPDFGYHYLLGGEAVNNAAGPFVRLPRDAAWRTSRSTSGCRARR